MRLFLKKVVPLTAGFLLFIRLWVFLFYALFGETKFATDIVNDFFHHYFLGIGLLAIVLFFRNKFGKYFSYIIAVSIALIIDEYTLILRDIGINLPYTYTSAVDHVSILLISALALAVSVII